MLGQEGLGPQAWLGGSWDCVLFPAFRPPDLAPPGKGYLPGALGISLDLDSLKAKKFFLVSDLSLRCSMFQLKAIAWFSRLFSFFSSRKTCYPNHILHKTQIYKPARGAAMCG